MNKCLFAVLGIYFLALHYNINYGQSVPNEVSFGNMATGQDFAFYEQDSVGVYGDLYLDAPLYFVRSNNSIVPKFIPTLGGNDCFSPIDGNTYGTNLYMKNVLTTYTTNANLLGSHYVNFSNKVTAQQLIQENATGTYVLNIDNLQMDNPHGLQFINNPSVRVRNNLNMQSGQILLSGGTLNLADNAQFTCFTKNSYVITNDDANIIINNKTRIPITYELPIGTKDAMSFVRVRTKYPYPVTLYSDTLSVSIDTFLNNINPGVLYHYTEGLGFRLKLRNLSPTTPNLQLDTLEMGFSNPDVFLNEKLTRNLTSDRGYISQYVGANTNIHGGAESESEWDLIPQATLNNSTSRFLYRFDWNKTNPFIMYSRTDKIDLNNTPNRDNFYAITTYNATPFKSKIYSFNTTLDAQLCLLNISAIMSDYYYKDLNYSIYLTNDTLKKTNTDNGVFYNFPFTSATLNPTTKELTHSISLLNLATEKVSKTKPAFVKLIQNDKYSPVSLNSFYHQTSLVCGPKMETENVDVTNPPAPVAYVENVDGEVRLIVEYLALYTEEINFQLFNITGEMEADLGSKIIYPQRNTLHFDLPSHISRQQRYLIVIYGGVLNPKLSRITISVYVP